MAKDKKKKKAKDADKAKSAKRQKSGGKRSKGAARSGAAETLKTVATNPMFRDIAAAALTVAAAALRDKKRTGTLVEQAGGKLEGLGSGGGDKGGAVWAIALEVAESASAILRDADAKKAGKRGRG